MKEGGASDQGAEKGGLVHLKYTYRYRSQFWEPDDEWMDVIKATCNEILGNYTKKEDEALTTAFGAWGKRRHNRVFYAIHFYILIIASLFQGKVRKGKVMWSHLGLRRSRKRWKFWQSSRNITMKRERERKRAVLPALVTSAKEVSIEAAPTNEPKV